MKKLITLLLVMIMAFCFMFAFAIPADAQHDYGKPGITSGVAAMGAAIFSGLATVQTARSVDFKSFATGNFYEITILVDNTSEYGTGSPAWYKTCRGILVSAASIRPLTPITGWGKYAADMIETGRYDMAHIGKGISCFGGGGKRHSLVV